jgi:PST family polysaccharide transporter
LWPVALGVISGVGLNMLSLRAATYQAREQFLRFSATTSCFYVLSLIGVGAVAALSRGRSATPVYATYLTASSLAGGYAWLTLARATRRMHASRRVLRSIISFAKWLFGANVGYMVTQRLDLFLVAGFGSLTAVGEYGAALRVVTTVSLMTGTLAPLLLPRAAKTRGEHDLVRDYLKHASALTGAIGCLLTVLWLAAPIAVRLLFGPGYADAARLARIILVGTFAIALYTPLSQLFMRDDAPRKMLYLSVIRLAVIAGVGAFAVPRIGAAGAAAAVASAEVSVLVYVCFALRHDLVAALRASSAPGAHPQAVPRPAVRVPR